MSKRLTYVEQASPLHRAHPLTKVAWLLLFCAVTFRLEHPLVQVGLLTLMFLGYGVARFTPSFAGKRLRTLALFALFIFAAQVVFTRSGRPLLHLPVVGLTITDCGLIAGANMALRFFNVIAASTLFVVTTEPMRLASALMQAGVPYRYGFTLVTALRFVPLLGTEAEAVRAAQLARGVALDRPSILGVWELIRYTLVPLTVSSLSRVEGLTIAMEGRAFGLYSKRTYRQPLPFCWRDALGALLAAVIAALLLIVVPRYLPLTHYLEFGG